jgi:lysophospholipase L1-like esterase
MLQTNYNKRWINQILKKSLKSTLTTMVLATAASSAFAATSLENGASVTNISGGSGSETFYTLAVPAGSSSLSFNISGGTGDADLYVKFGSQASSSNWDCRPYRNGNNEACNISTAQSGTYSVMLDAYTAYTGVTLVGNFTAPGGPPPPPPPVSGVENTAAAGDSITMAFAADCTSNTSWWNLFCLAGGDQPEHSWFDGNSSKVNSVHDRYKALDSSIGASKAAAESGSEMRGTSGGTKPNFIAQASDIVAQSPLPDHVEVLLGGNDICNRDCTDPANCDNPLFTDAQWRESVRGGLDTLMAGLAPGSTVQLNGMPRVQDIRQAGLDKQAASSRVDCDNIWSSYDICRIVTNGGSQFGESSALRLAVIAQTQQSYNAILAQEASAYNSNANGRNPNGIEVVSQYVNENTPSGGTFQFGANNIDGGDCFHPNVNTQGLIADFAWGANNDLP